MSEINTKKHSSIASFVLHFYRYRVMNLLIFLVISVYFTVRLVYTFPVEVKRYYDVLVEGVRQTNEYQQYINETNDITALMYDEGFLMEFRLLASYIEGENNIKQRIGLLNKQCSEWYTAYYLQNDGTVISDNAGTPLDLPKEELGLLCQQGTIVSENGKVDYAAVSCGEGWLIAHLQYNGDYQVDNNVLLYIPVNGFIYSGETGEVLGVGKGGLCTNFNELYKSKPLKSKLFTEPNLQVMLISENTKGFYKYYNMKLALISPLAYQNEGNYLCVYFSVTEILCNILMNSFLPALLFLLFMFLSICGSINFRQLWKKRDQESKIIRLPFHCYLNVALMRHILFTQICLGIIVILSSFLIQLLSNFNTCKSLSEYGLSQMLETNKICEEGLETYRTEYLTAAFEIADGVNTFLTAEHFKSYDDLRNILSGAVNDDFIREISVYNRDGENVCTTADHVGYPLSRNSDSPEYEFWNLMSGKMNYIVKSDGSDSHLTYCAVSRSDEVGVVVVTISDMRFRELEQKLSTLAVVKSTNIHKYSKIYMEHGNPETFYLFDRNGSMEKYTGLDLPTLNKGKVFCGLRTVNNKMYFVNGLGGEDCTVYTATEISEILDGLQVSGINLFIFLLVVCMLELLGSAVYADEADSADCDREEQNRFMSKLGKSVHSSDETVDYQIVLWKNGLYGAFFMVVAMLLLDLCLRESSLLDFLLNSGWEKGLNIFSLSLIAVAILATILIWNVLKHFFDELNKTLPARSATAAQMIYSILKIIVIIGLLIFALAQIGINTTAVLASVGISGLVFGISAKDTINDMLNGIFIILDGRVQVGDWVEVSGFYGQITHIGIRTTKLNRYHQEKCVNNSAMNNVLNYSRGTSSVYFSFVVPFDTDLQLLAKIIAEAAPRFQECTRGKLLSNASLLGVDDFLPYGLKCSFFAMAEEKDRRSAARKCHLMLKQILDENGICLAQETRINYDGTEKGNYLTKQEKITDVTDSSIENAEL